MSILDWLDDKTLVILGVLAITTAGAYWSPELVGEHLDAILAGLFGIVIGTKK